MTEPCRRIAFITPYLWDVPHPVNDHVATIAWGLATLSDDPVRVIVIAPSRRTTALRATRRALRDLARGAHPEHALTSSALVGDRGFPVLTPGVTLGAATVALRAGLRMLFAVPGLGLVDIQDPLDTDLTRYALRTWPGITAATFHHAPGRTAISTLTGPLRDRLLDQVDVHLIVDEAVRAPLSEVTGVPAADIVLIDSVTGPTLCGLDDASDIVIGRGVEDDLIVRALASASAAVLSKRSGGLVLMSRWFEQHRPSIPRTLRGRMRTLRARTRADADSMLSAAAVYVALPGTPARAVREAVVAGIRVLHVGAEDPVGQLPFLLTDALDGPTPIAPVAEDAPSIAGKYADVVAVPFARQHEKRPPGPPPSERSCIIDFHMHTNHSWDCATEPEVLMKAARDVGLTAIAVTDHDEVSGALVCAEMADEYGLQVIVGEEVKTSQGEVIGLFLTERIEGGLTWDETITAIRAQDGLVYVPHPFDRLHTIPDSHTLRETLHEIDAFEVYNSRLTFEQYNRDAARFAKKYNLTEAAGSDAHVPQGLGTAAVHMPEWDDPESMLNALRQGILMRRPKSLLYLQGLKWLHTMRGRSGVGHPDHD